MAATTLPIPSGCPAVGSKCAPHNSSLVGCVGSVRRRACAAWRQNDTIRQDCGSVGQYSSAMGTRFVDLLPAIGALADPARDPDLAEVAAIVGLSPSRVQRVVSEAIGESPKRFQRRTRLELGALLLVSTDARIVDIAFATGFQSHEVFSRSFAERFGESPTTWRSNRQYTLAHGQAKVAVSISRCMTLYRRELAQPQNAQCRTHRNGDSTMSYEITTRTIDEVPVLYQARRVERDQIASVLAEALPAVFNYVLGAGLAPAGHPYVRYMNMSAAFIDVEAGIPLVNAADEDPPEETAVLRGALPAGLVAATIHTGPYDGLAAAYEELDRWVEASEHTAIGGPWEVYLTDPAEVPDPADWKTEVFSPIS